MSYLPRSWALVVQGLTIAMSAFDCTEGHQIHCIIVLENDPDKEAYIRRQLIAAHDAGLSEGVHGGAQVVDEGTGVGVEEVHTKRTQSTGNFGDDEAKEGEGTQVLERTWEGERMRIWEIWGTLARVDPLGIQKMIALWKEL